ncbi:UNVERIFIED_CONTAM: Gem-associated protein 8 [Gekko kuhli]
MMPFERTFHFYPVYIQDKYPNDNVNPNSPLRDGKQQQLEAEHQDTYVEAGHDLHPSVGRSAQPPAEKPGERRLAEMKKLYGVGANKIQAMETTMQLSFDRNCDKKQPKYWPIIPLKL